MMQVLKSLASNWNIGRGAVEAAWHGDEDVRNDVLNALWWDLALPRFGLSVEVARGWVTLSGDLARPYQKGCAERDVRSVWGVTGVTNMLALPGCVAAE